ncbi:MAG: nucleotidyltransferase family protein [Stappiaceae bacterium]
MNMSAGIQPKFAMVLAAGIGKRMRPVTATTPKPLIEVGGQSMIDHGLDRLAAAGVETAVVNVHYLADLVEVHVSKRQTPNIVVSDERDALLETGGGVIKALPELGSSPFFVINTDSFWIEGVRPNLEMLIDAWDGDKMDMLLMLAPTVSSIGYSGAGDFSMSKEGLLSRRTERTVSPYVYAGVYLVHPRALEDEEPGRFSMNRVFDKLLAKDRLYGALMDGLWLHVGTPDAIEAANRAVLESAA